MGKLRASALAAAVFGMALGGPAAAAEKVVYDTDFNTMGDDGQAFVMLGPGHARGARSSCWA